MNILMVGHSRSGKTSFMAGMYEYLGEDTEGYGISAKQENQMVHLQKMGEELSKGKYPDGTDVQSHYEFAFTVRGRELIPFNWIDYRGGILSSDDPDDTDIEWFMYAIKKADALVVFLDGQKLVQPGARWNMEYDVLLSCIERSLTVQHDTFFPICFVITKADSVPDGATFHGLERFRNLFTQIGQSDQVGAMLLRCEITPENHWIPFFALAYCIYGGSPIYIRRCMDAIRSSHQRAESHRPTTLIGKVFAVGEQLFKEVLDVVDLGWETEYEKTWAADNTTESLIENFDILQACAEDLKEKLLSFEKEGGPIILM